MEEQLTSIISHLESIELLLNNAYTLLNYFICIFIIYQLYKFFSHFIFGGV